MLPVTLAEIRDSFINASRKEVSDLTLPPAFADLDWSRLDYLGWRDPKIARRAYVVVPTDDGLAAVMLRQAEAATRSRAQCSWCHDVTLPNEVVLYSARRAGAEGRKGDTVGTLLCADFQCSTNVRRLPPVAYLGFDVEAARTERMQNLLQRSAGFVRAVRFGA